MNNAAIIFRYTGDILPEIVVSSLVSIIRKAIKSSDDIHVMNATDEDLEDMSGAALMKFSKYVKTPIIEKPEELNPAENAIIYIHGIFDGNFSDMFPTRLAIKLHGKQPDDPLVTAVKIIGNDSYSYHNLCARVRNKYKITKQVFEEIKEVSHMLFN